MRKMWGIILLLIFLGCFESPPDIEKNISKMERIVQNNPKKVIKHKEKIKRIIDGDTFILENGEKVRIIGIDAPEKFESYKLNRDSENSGKDKKVIKALGYLGAMYTDSILYGQNVTLVSDSINANKDEHGRLLRYVYLENGEFFNLKIIQDGYAYAYTKYPFIFMEEFKQAEKEARGNEIGLWKNEDFKDINDSLKIFHNSNLNE